MIKKLLTGIMIFIFILLLIESHQAYNSYQLQRDSVRGNAIAQLAGTCDGYLMGVLSKNGYGNDTYATETDKNVTLTINNQVTLASYHELITLSKFEKSGARVVFGAICTLKNNKIYLTDVTSMLSSNKPIIDEEIGTYKPSLYEVDSVDQLFINFGLVFVKAYYYVIYEPQILYYEFKAWLGAKLTSTNTPS